MNKHKQIVAGIILGVLTTLLGSFLYLCFIAFTKDLSLSSSLDGVISQGRVGSLLTLGAIPTLLLFFWFIRKKQDRGARGVLMFVIFLAVGLLIYKLF